jgi:hypothetical protein
MFQIVLVVLSISAGDVTRESEIELADIETCLRASHHVMQVAIGDWGDLGLKSFATSCVFRLKAQPA